MSRLFKYSSNLSGSQMSRLQVMTKTIMAKLAAYADLFVILSDF